MGIVSDFYFGDTDPNYDLDILIEQLNDINHTQDDEVCEEDLAFESVFDFAFEGVRKKQILDSKTRDALPDEAFAIVFTDKDGKRQRKYPLIVKNDPVATKELIGRAIQYFHFANPKWKAEIAKAIIKAMNETGVVVKIHPRSQIHKYVDVPEKYTDSDTINKYHATKDNDKK